MSVFDWFSGADKGSPDAPSVDSSDKLALYESAWCPFCERVSRTIEQLGLAIQRCDTGQAEHAQALVAGGGKRMVPCLRIETAPDEYFWLYESADIMAYLRAHAERQK